MSRAAIRLVLGAAAALALVAGAAAADTFALVGGTVHPASGPAIPNGTVLVSDGRIAAVGAAVSVPPGTRVVSCAGKDVWPGLVSANTVIGLEEIESVRGTVDHSETGNVNPNIRAEVMVNPGSEVLPVTRLNGITSALVIPRGGAIPGTSSLMHLDGWTFEDMTIAAPVGLHLRWPAMTPVRSFLDNRSDEEQKKARDEAVDAIRKAFDDARAYETALAAEAKAGVPRHERDVRWDAMRRAIRGELPVYVHASTLAQIRAALRFADEQGLRRLVLVGGYDAWRIAGELKARDIPVVCDPTLAMPRRRYEPFDEAFTLPARLAAAGVRYCITDGAGGESANNARNLPYHAGKAIAYGLPADEALRGVTLYPARILGVGDRLGSIEAGKIADLVVTTGDLLDETSTIEQVYVSGRAIAMESKQTRLFHQYDARPRGPRARPR